MGRKCDAAFQRYGDEILDGMRWPAFLCGGLMAALAEEPFFRGVLSRWFEPPVLFGILLVLTGSLCVPMIAHGVYDVAAYRNFHSLRRSD